MRLHNQNENIYCTHFEKFEIKNNLKAYFLEYPAEDNWCNYFIQEQQIFSHQQQIDMR